VSTKIKNKKQDTSKQLSQTIDSSSLVHLSSELQLSLICWRKKQPKTWTENNADKGTKNQRCKRKTT